MGAHNTFLTCSLRSRFHRGILMAVAGAASCLVPTVTAAVGEPVTTQQIGVDATSYLLTRVVRLLDDVGPAITQTLKDAECCIELHDAMRLQLAAVWNKEATERLTATLGKDASARRLLGTLEMWRAIVKDGEQSLREKWGSDIGLQLRMVRARFDLPVAKNEREVFEINGAEAISPVSVPGMLADLAGQYELKYESLEEPDRASELSSEQHGRMSFLCLQLNFVQKPALDANATRNRELNAVPTARIWIAYDVITRTQSQRPDETGTVEQVEVQFYELANESGAWRRVKGPHP